MHNFIATITTSTYLADILHWTITTASHFNFFPVLPGPMIYVIYDLCYLQQTHHTKNITH